MSMSASTLREPARGATWPAVSTIMVFTLVCVRKDSQEHTASQVRNVLDYSVGFDIASDFEISYAVMQTFVPNI